MFHEPRRTQLSLAGVNIPPSVVKLPDKSVTAIQRCLPVLGDALLVYGVGPKHDPPKWLGELALVLHLKLKILARLTSEQINLPARRMLTKEDGE